MEPPGVEFRVCLSRKGMNPVSGVWRGHDRAENIMGLFRPYLIACGLIRDPDSGNPRPICFQPDLSVQNATEPFGGLITLNDFYFVSRLDETAVQGAS